MRKGYGFEWIFQYNYERTHQRLGGLLAPSDRFHGLTDLALCKLGKALDPHQACWYSNQSIERSIFNVTVGPEGKMTLSLLCQRHYNEESFTGDAT